MSRELVERAGWRPAARSAEARAVLARAERADEPAESFQLAYRAARTAAAALLSPRAPRRGATDVWSRLSAEVPELGPWAEVLAGYSPLSAALEVGMPRRVDHHMARDFGWAVGRFLDVVDRRLGVLASAA